MLCYHFSKRWWVEGYMVWVVLVGAASLVSLDLLDLWVCLVVD